MTSLQQAALARTVELLRSVVLIGVAYAGSAASNEAVKLTTQEKPSTLKASWPEPPPRKRRRRSPSGASEFLALPPQQREQALRYVRRWWEGVSR
ncbi:MAG: hypothetical protein Q8O40_01685 [Chloroflexota bacterium]|nr:hypothetical protein [Chloroflexota bacterium]